MINTKHMQIQKKIDIIIHSFFSWLNVKLDNT